MSLYSEVTTSMEYDSSLTNNLSGTFMPPIMTGTYGSLPHVMSGNGTLNETNGDTLDNTDPTAYFGDVFMHFNYNYRQVHGSFSLAVCVFGIIANVLNIIVLTRKNMMSPTNLILGAMAVSDLLVIASYIPFVIHNFIRRQVPLEDMYTYGWALFTLLHSHNSVVFHTISIWLTVLLAVWRYLTVRSPQTNKTQCSMKRAAISILITYLAVPVFCIPIFVCFTIYPFKDDHPNSTISNVTLYKVDIDSQQFLLGKINFWVFSVLLKLIPCILLTCLSLALVRILIDARKRKERLLGAKFADRKNSSALNNVTQHQQSPINLSPHRSPSLIQPNQIFQEVTNNSPTGFDQSSKGNKANNSPESRVQSILHECCLLVQCAPCAQTLDQCTCCCGYVCCCFGAGGILCPSESPSKIDKTKHRPSTVVVTAPHQHHNHSHNASNSSGNSERTTRMLIAILIMFLVCEFPSGILALLSGILGKVFFSNVYNNFGELMDMMALINSAVNFVLYCLMSQQFRKTFSQLFCIRWTEEVTKQNGNVVKRTTLGLHEHTVVTEMIGSPNGKMNKLSKKKKTTNQNGASKIAYHNGNKRMSNVSSHSSNNSFNSKSSKSSRGSKNSKTNQTIEIINHKSHTNTNNSNHANNSVTHEQPKQNNSTCLYAVQNNFTNNNNKIYL